MSNAVSSSFWRANLNRNSRWHRNINEISILQERHRKPTRRSLLGFARRISLSRWISVPSPIFKKKCQLLIDTSGRNGCVDEDLSVLFMLLSRFDANINDEIRQGRFPLLWDLTTLKLRLLSMLINLNELSSLIFHSALDKELERFV